MRLRNYAAILLGFFFIFPADLTAQSANYVGMDITLSGTVLFGINYTRQENRNLVKAGVYIGMKGKPVGISLGYHRRMSDAKDWIWQNGIEFDLMAAKDDKKGMKYLPLIKYVPALVNNKESNPYAFDVWLVYFPLQKKAAPVGLRFSYWLKQ